jgi:hypothetical protein
MSSQALLRRKKPVEGISSMRASTPCHTGGRYKMFVGKCWEIC